MSIGQSLVCVFDGRYTDIGAISLMLFNPCDWYTLEDKRVVSLVCPDDTR